MGPRCEAALSYGTGRVSGHRCGQRAGWDQATWAWGLWWRLGFYWWGDSEWAGVRAWLPLGSWVDITAGCQGLSGAQLVSVGPEEDAGQGRVRENDSGGYWSGCGQASGVMLGTQGWCLSVYVVCEGAAPGCVNPSGQGKRASVGRREPCLSGSRGVCCPYCLLNVHRWRCRGQVVTVHLGWGAWNLGSSVSLAVGAGEITWR